MRSATAALALALAACATTRSPSAARPPLGDQGEIFVYLQPFPEQAARLSFSIASIAAVAPDGREAPLEIVRRDHSGGPPGRDQLLAAFGRVEPGSYAILRIGLAAAALRTREGKADLLVPDRPFDVGGPFAVQRGGATVLELVPRAIAWEARAGVAADAFAVVVPDSPVPEVVGYCSGADGLVTVDTRRKQVASVVATSTPPRGVAIDPVARRAYAALPDEDAIAVVDVSAREPLRRIRLASGDRPVDVALARDRRTLVVVNAGANDVSFVEPSAGIVLARVPAGDEPAMLLMDREARRAYVLNRFSRTVTVVDVANRAAVATLAIDGQPLQADVSRAGDRLYVVAQGTPFLSVFRTRELSLEKQVHVGLGATTVRVDPTTDLLYVGRGDVGTISVYDPLSLVPLDVVEVPGPARWLAIDTVEKTLYAVVPDRRATFVVDLATGRTLSAIDVGAEPRMVALPVPRI